jgi:DNA adenine methylase
MPRGRNAVPALKVAMTASRQLSLFPALVTPVTPPQPVNVATVLQRSPLRYAGGKTWLVPTFKRWWQSLQPKPRLLVEPFVGGGIISLTAVFENLVDHAVMVELDKDVAAVWQSIINGDGQWIADQILHFHLTKELVIAEIDQPPRDLKHRAFQTILKNRTFYGGVLTDEAARFLRCGESGERILNNWWPRALAKRLRHLDFVVDRIDFRHADGLQVMREFTAQEGAMYFIDPPYTMNGKERLYQHCEIDHEELFSLCAALQGDFLLTYDEREDITHLARQRGFEMKRMIVNNGHNAAREALVISRDLSWMDDAPVVL